MTDSLFRYLGSPLRALAVTVTVGLRTSYLQRYIASPMRGFAVEGAIYKWGGSSVLVHRGIVGFLRFRGRGRRLKQQSTYHRRLA